MKVKLTLLLVGMVLIALGVFGTLAVQRTSQSESCRIASRWSDHFIKAMDETTGALANQSAIDRAEAFLDIRWKACHP